MEVGSVAAGVSSGVSADTSVRPLTGAPAAPPSPQRVAGYPRSHLDLTTSPQANFYQFALGGYQNTVEIPADKSSYGIRAELGERVETELLGILDRASKSANAPGSVEQKIGDFFAAGLDTEAMDALGKTPIVPYLEAVEKITDRSQLQGAITHLHTEGIAALFSFGSATDLHDPNSVIGWADQSGLGLRGESYYTKQDPASVELREKYVDHIARVFGLLGTDAATASAQANAVMAIETRLAKTWHTSVEARNPQNYDHKVTRAQLVGSQQNFSWDRYLQDVGVSADSNEFNVGNPKFFGEVDKMLADVPVEDWKAYLSWQVARQSSASLSAEFREAHFDFYSATLSGVKEKSPRWREMVSLTDSYLGEAVGIKFVEKNFTPEAKAKALEMVHNVMDVMREQIANRDWMGPETKKEALAKLDTMVVKIGYPDKWEDYSDFPVDRSSFFANVMTGKRRTGRKDIEKIGKPVDRESWGITPSTVNAYYSPQRNEIAFPAARLLPPFFDPNADDATNYGTTGVTVGHELTHGFDDSGALYDSTGALRNWWQPKDLENFKKITGAVAEHMSSFSFAGIQTNGELTTGEALADLGGMELAYKALKKARAGKPPVESSDGFTDSQRFFLSYAISRQNKLRTEAAKTQIQTGVHPLPEFRVHGAVTNYAPFFEAFDVQPGDPMYRKPEDRISLWG
jgi:putative endopeptidase